VSGYNCSLYLLGIIKDLLLFCGLMPLGQTPPPLPPPRWVVSCRGCFKTFVQSYVGHARHIEDYLRPTEPEVPNEGIELECPKCKTKAVYYRTDLRYISR
jgi:hypothetical protein